MKQTMKHMGMFMLVLACAVGLAFMVALVPPAVAGPVGVTPLPPVDVTDGRAGACFSYYPDPLAGTGRPFLQRALDAGSRWDRFPFEWYRIEPVDGTWSPIVRDGYDSLVNDLHAAGMNMVGILLWTPDWAATGGPSGSSVPNFDEHPTGWYAPIPHVPLPTLSASSYFSPPIGLDEEWNDWTTGDGDPINYWGRFVYQVVERYGDRVKYWEMWNEPEWSAFWTGTSTDYAQLLKVGYQATKAACLDCTVLFGGLHYWQNPRYYRWVLSIINMDPTASQNNYFFDVMSVHLYSRSSSIYDEVGNIHSGMSVYNVGDHPIWLTETGVEVWDDARVDPSPTKVDDYTATQEEAAAYVIQSYANAWAADVERYFFFRTHDADAENLGGYYGLVRNDHTLRPAYVAYQVATSVLISPTFVTRILTGSYMHVTLWGTPRGKVSVLWNGSPITSVYMLTAAYTPTATLPTATLVDRWGITRTVTATGGVYTFTLPGATANLTSTPSDYIIGGDPLIVVESETPNALPTATVQALPEITYTPTFTVTWEGQDSGSGVWLYDVQVRDGAGEWDGLQHSAAATSTQFAGRHGHTYHFRARATDRVGNRSTWPEVPQAHTTLNLANTLHLSIGAFFADENYNGVWDEPIAETNEITLTEVALRFLDEARLDVVSPTVGSAWEFTTTVYAGQHYRLQATTADYARILPLSWLGGGEAITEQYPALGLWPVKRTYLPLVLRQASGGM